MRPVFSDYISQLPPELVFRHLLKHGDQNRKIVSASTVRRLADQFSTAESLARRFNAFSESARLDCALAYLYGDKGLPAEPVTDFDNDKLLCSFLLYLSRQASGR